MAITGISAIGNQQIIAAGAQSATKAYQDSNGGVITSKYQTTAGMSNYQTTAGMSDYATTASVTGKQDALTFGYIDDQISQINGSGIYSQGGGGVVTATGGTTAYVQTINSKNISATNAGSALSATDAYNLTNTAIKVASATSANYALAANTATYASNGVSLTNIYNSARSGYAASAYLVNNVTGKVSNWNNSYSAVTANSAYWGRVCSLYQQTDTPSLTSTAGVGPAGLRFNIGSMITYGGLKYRVIIEQLDSYVSAYNLNFCFSDVIGTQWSQVNNVISVRNGHIIAPYIINIWGAWENEPRIQLVNSDPYITSGPAILRNVRNTSTADNNAYFGNGIIYVAGW